MWTWLFTTKAGRTALIVGVTVIATLLSWWAFSSHYEQVGYNKCKAEQTKDALDATIDQGVENEDRNATASELAKDAVADAEKVKKDNAAKTAKTKEEIHNEYREPPKTAPIAYQSCVHAVAPGVQKRIGQAVRSANADH